MMNHHLNNGYAMKKNNNGFWVTLIGIIIAIAVAYGLYKLFFTAPPEAPQMPPPAVSVIEIQPANLPLSYEYAGRTTGSREVEIRARVSGILLKRAYTEGQPVKQGDVLFRIDPAPFEAELAQAQARLTQTERDWKRAEALIKEKALSPREYDEAKSAYEQARAAVKTARINLDYTTVTAPISGITSKESLSEGSLVSADTSLLTTLAQLDPIYVDFSIPDSEAIAQRQQLASGALTAQADGKLTAEVFFGDTRKEPYIGHVNFTDSVIDPQTGTVRARAVLPNADNAILPGQFVRVNISGLVLQNAITIPDAATMQGPMGTFVYTVLTEGDTTKAAITPVVLGALADKQRIVTSGLKAGDKVITEGMIKVQPDAPVTIADPNAAPPEGGAPAQGDAPDTSAAPPAAKE